MRGVVVSGLAAGFALLALAAPANAACVAPEKLAALTGAHDFVQTRTLKGVARPLVSSGTVTPEADGVLWAVTSPVKIVTHVTPTGITQSIEDAPETPVGPSSGGNPFITETGLIELLKGDLSKLDTRYEVKREARAKPEGWKLQLKPKGSALAPYISSIAVEGCQRVESIAVSQANGDMIRIDLKDKP
jgi:hypothetical protein